MSTAEQRNLTPGPTEDQIRVAAMNGGATAAGSKVVAEIVAEYPALDLNEVIAEVAGSKGKDDKDEIVNKLFKKAEKDKDKPAPRLQANTAPLPGTKEYNNTPEK